MPSTDNMGAYVPGGYVLGRAAPECDDFFLHLSSSDMTEGKGPSNFTVNLSYARQLPGHWKLALKEMSYTKWSKERSCGEEMQFLVFANDANVHSFSEYTRWLVQTQRGRLIYHYSPEHFPGIPNASIFAFNKDPDDLSKGTYKMPDGHYESPDGLLHDINQMLHEMWTHQLFHNAPYFYMVDKGTRHKTVKCSWQYPKHQHRRVGVLPLLAPKSRSLLGFPAEWQSPQLKRILEPLFATPGQFPDAEIGDDGFTQGRSNVFVLCDTVSVTGARTDMDGQILRILPNRGEPNGRAVHYDFTEDYYETTPKSTFFSIHMRLVNSETYQGLNLVHPTTFTLHFIPVNKCVRKSG